jgi:divalent metal cation (Fe/Co/Zn/Cd) transporter
MKLLRYLKNAYYRLFYFFFGMEKRDGQGGEETNRFAAVVALLPISLLCYSGLFLLLYIISRFVTPLPLPSATFFIIFAIVDVGLNGLLFLYKKRYLRIKELFCNEDHDRRFKRSLCCIVFTVVILFSMFILMGIFGNPWVK